MKKYLTLLVAFFIPFLASAATLTLSPDPSTVGVGDTVQITISISSDTPVNTFAGSLNYPKNLSPVSVSDGSSIISIWFMRPSLDIARDKLLGTSSPIVFSGFTPGGFSGRNGKLFSIVFKAMSAGPVEISLTDVAILLNDGAGTKEATVVHPLSLVIAQKATGGFTEPTDAFPPEPFNVFLGEDTQLFNGEKYLVFTTVDKGLGMDFYEVAEKRFPLVPPVWQKADSPYRIQNQYLTSDVYIKAVDRAGNERVMVFHRSHLLRPYEWVIFGMLIVALCILYMYMRGRGRFSLR